MSVYLRRTPALIDVAQSLTDAGPDVWGLKIAQLSGRPPGTVYPLLERLESAGLLTSHWETEDERPGPRRRLYSLTQAGRDWARTLRESQTVRSGRSDKSGVAVVGPRFA